MTDLKYRRENNFFEKGDKVVFGGSPLLHTVHKFSRDSDDMYILGWGWTKKRNVKHASDKEIAQGYRDE